MINSISISNYKSLINLEFSPTRINLLLGENGAGKSNILEALAIYSAAKSNMLSNEFLVSRGIRPIDPLTTICKLHRLNETTQEDDPKQIQFLVAENQTPVGVWVYHDETDPYKQLKAQIYTARPVESEDEEKSYIIHSDTESNHKKALDDLFKNYSKLVKNFDKPENISDIYSPEFNEKVKNISDEKYLELQDLKRNIQWVSETLTIIDCYKNKKSLKSNFVIFNPEINTLMGDKALSQIQPLGINGEGLFTLLKVMAQSEPENFQDVLDTATIFNWLEKIEIDEDPNSKKVFLKDRFMNSYISPCNANEGFLFTLFYASLFCSNQTPSIFAIENIDKSLNPRLCL